MTTTFRQVNRSFPVQGKHPADPAVEAIAEAFLEIQTLAVRNRDSLDFHEVGVTALRSALLAAYELGRSVGECKK
ncbi:MAG: hypothetical protein WC761_00215 [Candidatus Paceibacterota bacterium]